MENKVLSIDIGFGQIKVVYMVDGEIVKKFKIPTVLGLTSKDDFIQDDRLLTLNDIHYYVGDDALQVSSEDIISVETYEQLETFAPLFLFYAIKQIKSKPDIIITGLSKAHAQHSAYFADALRQVKINNQIHEFEHVFVLPQGAGSKTVIDTYGNDFPNVNTDFLGQANYFIIDIGFSTFDIAQVINGIASPNKFEGIEGMGVIQLALQVQDKINKQFTQTVNGEVVPGNYSVKEAKEFLDQQFIKYQGKKHDLKAFIAEIKIDYIKMIIELMKDKYGDVIHKADFIFMSGGGSYMFAGIAGVIAIDGFEADFFKMPKSNNEFYNSIGYAMWGNKKMTEIKNKPVSEPAKTSKKA